MKILGLIPARGGSKGVPRKNIKNLGGKPLIAYTIEAALNSKEFDSVMVSTDDEEIARVSASFGAEIPELRPASIASDFTPMLDVIRYVIEWCRRNNRDVDAICLLQPTNPFRTNLHISDAISRFKNNDFDSLISVLEVPAKYNPNWVFVEESPDHLRLFNGEKEPIARRQDLPAAYIREGSIYLFKTDTVERFNNIYGEKIGYMIMKEDSVNIDTVEDFTKAEKMISKSQVQE